MLENLVTWLATSPLNSCHPLTHLSLDKKATALADDIFKAIFLNQNDRIQIQIPPKIVPRTVIDNKPTLIQATSHYLNQFWPTLLMHICSTRGRWVKRKLLSSHIQPRISENIKKFDYFHVALFWGLEILMPPQSPYMSVLNGTRGQAQYKYVVLPVKAFPL